MSITANALTRTSLTAPSLTALGRALSAPQRRVLRAVIAAAEAIEAPLWLVGGPVRDLAAGLPLRDLDFATDADAFTLAEAVAARLDGTEAHAEPRFGTASVRLADNIMSQDVLARPRSASVSARPEPVEGPRSGGNTVGPRTIDFARLRTETYARPGALPTVTSAETIEADLARRDFTVNAIALGLAGRDRGRLVDPFEGMVDLARRTLRILHPESFRDDATRLWRGARFAARLDLRPDPATADAIEAGLRYLAPISPRRLWREFALVAAEPRAGAAVRLLEAWGVLAATHPALVPTAEAARALRTHRGALTPDLLLALLTAPRSPRERAEAATRLGAPRTAIDAAEGTASLMRRTASNRRPPLPRWERAGVRVTGAPAAASPIDPGLLESLTHTSQAARTAARWLDAEAQRPLQAALARWERTRPHLDARALLALGVPPGPEVGRWLAELRRARYLGTLDSAAAARRLVRSTLANAPHDRLGPQKVTP